MSALEFGEWIAFFKAEQLHPAAQRLRHAQAMAALHNGALSRQDKALWTTAQFMPADPWAPPEPPPAAPTPASIAAQVAAINARFEADQP